MIIWDTQAFSYDEVKRFEGAQLPEQCLQKPLRIRPRKNELVLINTRRPHAICGFDSGKRVSMQSFIGYTPANRFTSGANTFIARAHGRLSMTPKNSANMAMP